MTVLSKAAIEAYCKRPTDDWEWVKRMGRAELLSRFHRRWGAHPIFKTSPYLHQLQALYLGVLNRRFGMFLSMGTGKTKIAIDLISYLQDFMGGGRALVVCFNEASIYGWQEEVLAHSDYLVSHSCIGSRKEKELALKESESDVHLMTYSGVFSYCTAMGKPNKKGKKKRYVVPDSLGDFQKYDIVVFDEVHKLMHSDSGVSSVCRHISDYCRFVYGMTGTPTGRDPGSLFSEMLVIDQGLSFGRHEEVFNKVFYNTLWVAGRGSRGFPKRTINRRMTPELRRMMHHRSITYELGECFEVPSIVRQTIHVPMTKEMREHHKDIITEARDAQKEEVVRNLFVRYRQLMGGTRVLDPTDDSEGMRIPLRSSPKVEQMLELIYQCRGKAVVFYEFNATRDLAVAALKSQKVPFSSLWGGIRDAEKQVDKFRTGNSRVMLAQWRSGGTALNLQVAATVIFLESPCSYIERQQCEARIRPHLQTRSFIYDLVIARSLDGRILEYHKEGEDLFKAVVSGKVMLDDC